MKKSLLVVAASTLIAANALAKEIVDTAVSDAKGWCIAFVNKA